jgi:hypothetical protein
MRYMMMVFETEADFAQREDPAKSGGYFAAWGAYVKALHEAGIVTSGSGLMPPHTATTLRLRQGEREVQDGPYADSKEQLAGFFIIDVPDLDTALQWAARSPSATSAAVEIRPVLPPMQ